MKIVLKNGLIYENNVFKKKDILIEGKKILSIDPLIKNNDLEKVIHCDNFFIVPGFFDAHVHLREPGYSYKETIATGTKAAMKGGYTGVSTMPNLNPPPTNLQNLKIQLELIKKYAQVEIIPYGRISKNETELADMEEMRDYVLAYSDDGFGVQDESLMKQAMMKAKELGKIIVAHCEDERFSTYQPESEWKQVERDINLARETACAYHVCHVSTAESIQLIREAKKEGLDVTCETAPHYLVFNNENLPDQGRYKMNPPIRTEKDRLALIEGIQDGTIDFIVTDHAPHSKEEKARGFKNSLFGVVGMETAFPVLYTHLVLNKIIDLGKLIDLMAIAPRKRFGIAGDAITIGGNANLTILDLDKKYRIDSSAFESMGKSTPFEGMEVTGSIVNVIINGELK